MHLRRSALRQDVDCQVTHEWFGSGAKSGFGELLISRRFAEIILRERWRGALLRPVELF